MTTFGFFNRITQHKAANLEDQTILFPAWIKARAWRCHQEQGASTVTVLLRQPSDDWAGRLSAEIEHQVIIMNRVNK